VSNPTAIVGAGLAGLVAAQELRRQGRPVVVLESAAVPGGRLATAQVGGGIFDHGAQFFTTRSEAFTTFAAELVAGGVAFEWCRGFNEVDGYPRYACHGGMAALADHLAVGLDVRTGVAVRSVGPARGAGSGAGVVVDTDGGALAASAVVLTPPVPQSLALLERFPVDPALRDVRYHRVLALLVSLDGPSAVPEPGARQLADGPFSFVADNRRKGISTRSAVTFHAAHGLSAERWDAPDAEVEAELLAEAWPWLGDATVSAVALRRWEFSGPVTPWPEPCGRVADGVVIAGDAFAGPKVEGAYLSGLAAAAALT
jgi:predicted NAD/FAD-dependent oxidoreductase